MTCQYFNFSSNASLFVALTYSYFNLPCLQAQLNSDLSSQLREAHPALTTSLGILSEESRERDSRKIESSLPGLSGDYPAGCTFIVPASGDVISHAFRNNWSGLWNEERRKRGEKREGERERER